MKRNWDTIREILVRVEQCSTPGDMLRLSSFPEDKRVEVAYHMALLIEAGLVQGRVLQTMGPEAQEFLVQRLTWNGHEFLDTIRNDTIWARTKKVAIEGRTSATFEIIKDVAKEQLSAVVKGAIGSS